MCKQEIFICFGRNYHIIVVKFCILLLNVTNLYDKLCISKTPQEVPMVEHMDYIRILRDLREDADKTQTQIAEVLGTSQTMYARYERGANELPIHHLITLSKYYGVSTDYLLGLSKER